MKDVACPKKTASSRRPPESYAGADGGTSSAPPFGRVVAAGSAATRLFRGARRLQRFLCFQIPERHEGVAGRDLGAGARPRCGNCRLLLLPCGLAEFFGSVLFDAPCSFTARFYLSCSNFSAAELMQYRSPLGRGPSSNTCPRCASHRLHLASVRVIPWLPSDSVSTACLSAVADKLVHPEPGWYLGSERNSGWPQQTHLSVPESSVLSYSPVNGGSLPFSRVT